MTTIPVRRFDGAAIPKRATPNAAGYDLTAALFATIPPGEHALIRTSLAIALPDGWAAWVTPRSGLALHHGVTVLNAPGLIDPDYRGTIGVVLINHGNKAVKIKPGDRIAQLVFTKVETPELQEAPRLTDTQRGTGGFGSTGG